MLAPLVAEGIKEQVRHYLEATFEFRDKEVRRAFSDFINHPESGLFLGTWIQLKRPFKVDDKTDISELLDIDLPFRPYVHQVDSWKNLSSKIHKKPKHAVVTTGTGSGKTECFLYPILDYCLRQAKAGHRGIKAIVLYPMNALASDQERRFAEEIWNSSELRNAGIRVGIYTGENDRSKARKNVASGHKEMGETYAISHRDTLIETPPDILLTNYKMLDLMLMRVAERGIWKENLAEDNPLQYVVLDELHTYEGAQGADVACLIRRLKARLNIPRGKLCFVGTSATLEEDSSGKDGEGDQVTTSRDLLAQFAGKIFEESIDPNQNIIGESRKSISETLALNPELTVGTRGLEKEGRYLPEDGEELESYLKRQVSLWGIRISEEERERVRTLLSGSITEEVLDEVALAEYLKKEPRLRSLLELSLEAEQKKKVVTTEEFATKLFPMGAPSERKAMFLSFLSLIAVAKEIRGGRAKPFLSMQAQIWLRQLGRVGRKVSEAVEAEFCWLDSPPNDGAFLPTFHCGECHASGWVVFRREETRSRYNNQGWKLNSNTKEIYEAYFEDDRRIALVCPKSERNGALDVPTQLVLDDDEEDYFLFPRSLVLRKGEQAPEDGEKALRVVFSQREGPKRAGGGGSVRHNCPCCGKSRVLFFVGVEPAVLASVAIDSLYNSKLNVDPKLLAFNDSVQDASYHAGFYSSRTYSFTFRTALQQVIEAKGEEGLPVLGSGKELVNYWAEELFSGDKAKAVEALIPKDLLDVPRVYSYLNDEKRSLTEILREKIELRLSWEAISSFGARAKFGRTLERVGASCFYLPLEIYRNTASELRQRIADELPALKGLSEEQLLGWVVGLNHYYRWDGCLYHPYVDDLVERKEWRRYKEGKSLWQPRDSRFGPQLLAKSSVSGRKYIIPFSKGKAQSRSWYFDWCRRSLGTQVSVDDLIDLGGLLLKAGGDTGLYRRFVVKDEHCFITDTKKAKFLGSPAKLSVGENQTEVNVAEEFVDIWKALPSLGMYQTKRYSESTPSSLDLYYRNRFSKGIPRKVIAREHTGLLRKTDREELETRFKTSGADRRGDDPNLLTCTSTLEMGINIGDLSSTLLCSIPPTTSNYLQRVGRAGRLTGSALIFAIVNQRPHDAFFVSRPVEMLKGEVKAPNCWLDASAVLTRQFVAYSLDTATKENVYEKFPGSAKDLENDYLKEHTQSSSRKWLAWLSSEIERLYADFEIRFEQDSGVKADTWERFKQGASPKEIANRVGEVIRTYSKEKRALDNSISRLKDRLAKADTHDEETKREIRAELAQLKNQKQSTAIQDAIGLLCTHGVLPNYAFPEKGVRFYGQAFRDSEDGAEKIQSINVDTVRAASSAIRELAPYNTFYSHGCKFPIRVIPIAYSGGGDGEDGRNGNSNRIELFSKWRMCPNCGFSKKILADEERGICPQCGSSRFADIKREKDVVEFSATQAKSFVDINAAAVEDARESRESTYYHVVASIDTSSVKSSQAVGSESAAFGIEFFPAAQLFQFNGGYRTLNKDFPMGRESAAGQESVLNALGFRFCLDCGAVGHEDGRVAHLSNCIKRHENQKKKQQGEEEDDSAYNYKQAYLGRELISEAVRLLFPYSDRVSVNTFSACLNLGLKLKHQGKPGEVRVEYQAIPEGDGKDAPVRRYMVLMDTVPGGTGFLKSLFEEDGITGNKGDGIIEILELALETLRTCPCGRKSADEEEIDGCYRCIRSYHQQYQAEHISRERGIALLEEFVRAARKFEKVEGLSNLGSAKIFDSELEQRFIERLQQFCEEVNADFEETIVRGKQGYRVSLPGTGVDWEVETYSPIGKEHGVQESSEADFLFIPNKSGMKPIAVFADGFEYHGKDLDTLRGDIRKRRAILNSGNFLLWQVGWKDVCTDYDPVDEPSVEWHSDRVADEAKKLFRDRAHKEGQHYKPINFHKNSFELLTEFLRQPEQVLWEDYAKEYAKLHVYMASEDKLFLFGSESSLNETYTKWLNCEDRFSGETKGHLIAAFPLTASRDVLFLTSEELIDEPLIYSRFQMETREGFNTEPGFEMRWLSFWRILNQYQFLGRVNLFGTEESIEGYGYWELPEFRRELPLTREWSEALEEVLAKARPKLELFAHKAGGKYVPEVEYEPDFRTEGFAELAWEEEKVCVLAGEQEELAAKWENNGWKVFNLVQWMEVTPGEFLNLLRERT